MYPMRRTSACAWPSAAAQRRTAPSTSRASGHLKTDVVQGRTGITYGLLTLDGPVMFKGGPCWMTIRITRGDVKIVQHFGLSHEFCRHSYPYWQFAEQLGHNVSPGFLTRVQMKCPDSLLSRLVRCEARPLVPPSPARVLGLL